MPLGEPRRIHLLAGRHYDDFSGKPHCTYFNVGSFGGSESKPKSILIDSTLDQASYFIKFIIENPSYL